MAAFKEGVSVVVPCYNCSATISELLERTNNVLDASSYDFEIILVNDGSHDGTWQIIKEQAKARDKIKAVNMMRNYGQHNALLCGIRKASFDHVLTMDDDLQHPPEEIPKLFKAMNPDVDIIYGSPNILVHGYLRNMASRTIKLILSLLLSDNIARKVSPFRFFRTQLREAFDDYDSQNVSIDVLLSWGTTKYASADIFYNERQAGKSNYSFLRLISFAFDMLTGYSALPLRIASLTGFFLTIFGIAVLVYVIASLMIEGRQVPGFAFLASIISIFAGAQLFALGIIGEYIARIHFRAMKLPTYVVKEEIP